MSGDPICHGELRLGREWERVIPVVRSVFPPVRGFGGCPYSYIAPGIGYPTGWNNVGVAWGPKKVLGIGVELTDCGLVPTRKSTWGGIKALFKD